MTHSLSTGNLNIFDEESVVTRLDNKLREFANKKTNASKDESFEVIPKENKNDNKTTNKMEKLHSQNDKVVDRQLTSNQKVKRLSSAARRYKFEEEKEKTIDKICMDENTESKEEIGKKIENNDLFKKGVSEEAEEEKVDSYESEESAQYTEPESTSSSSEESDDSTPISSQRPASSKMPETKENDLKSFQSKRLVVILLALSNLFYRKFFEELGPIKLKELKPKPADTIKEEVASNNQEMTPLEKVSLWLPANETKLNIVDAKKKLNLLSQLNAIDDGRDSPYNPSFNNTDQKQVNGIANRATETSQFASSNENNFEQSKLGKKASLMTELFGDTELSNNVDSQHSKPLKTSLKTTQGSGKAVKFYEE